MSRMTPQLVDTGRWTVLIDYLQLPAARTDYYCWCRCQCGNYRLIRRNHMSKSCGCLAAELASARRKLNIGNKHHGWKGGHRNRGTIAWANKILGQARNYSRIHGFVPPAITSDELVKLYHEFIGICPICLREIDKTKGRKLCLDHCHKSGLVRGFICHHCNACLGWLEKRFQFVLNYLEMERKCAI